MESDHDCDENGVPNPVNDSDLGTDDGDDSESDVDDQLANPLPSLEVLQWGVGQEELQARHSERMPRKRQVRATLRPKTPWMDSSRDNVLHAVAHHKSFGNSYRKMQMWLLEQPTTHAIDKSRLRHSDSAVKDKAVNIKKECIR